MHVAAEHGHVDVIRMLAESWVLCWIHQTRTDKPRGCTRTTATVEDNGAVAEALNALGMEHPGDVIIEPSSYTPDGTPVYRYTVPQSSGPAMVSDRGAKHARSPNRGGASLTDGRSSIRVRSITTGTINELMKASTLGNVAQIESLVAGGVDVETQDDLGWRPIHMAAERGQPKSVRALARLGS
jgi:hypothetical protein